MKIFSSITLHQVIQKLLAGLILALTASVASAQNVEPINCEDGDVLAGAYEDVTVDGTSCILDGATIYGSVFVHGGSLRTTSNGAMILGGIHLKSGGDVTLEATHVWDEMTLQQSGNLIITGSSTVSRISMKNSGNLSVGASALAGEVELENSGDIAIRGSVAAILSKKSGGIRLTNAIIFPGGVTMSLSSGALEICGSTIGGISDAQPDGSGGINVLEGGDVLAAAEGSCAKSQIEGSVIVQKGTGKVRLVGTTLHSDLIVIEQIGDVEVNGSDCDPLDPLCGTLSDINIEKLTGNVTLKSVTTDSDTTVVGTHGRVTIDASTLGSDVRVRLNKSVQITNNSFSLEDVLIANNDGPVLFDRNCDGRLTIIENENVIITNNNPVDATSAGVSCKSEFGFSDADISKNSGSVLIENNTGEGLSCADNSPAPAQGLTGNTITFSDGQCAGF